MGFRYITAILDVFVKLMFHLPELNAIRTPLE